MLKWILVVVFIAVISCGYAEIGGYFETGYGIEKKAIFTKAEIQYWLGQSNIKNELYGGWETWSFRNYPFLTLYSIGDRIHINDFYFQIEHGCNHSVYSEYNVEFYDRGLKALGTLTTISVGVKW